MTNVGLAAASSGDTFAAVAAGADGRVFYNWWNGGEGTQGWSEIDGGGLTDTTPAIALTGDQVVVAIKEASPAGTAGRILFNYGSLGGRFSGWVDQRVVSLFAPALGSGIPDTRIVAPVNVDGSFIYRSWQTEDPNARGATPVWDEFLTDGPVSWRTRLRPPRS